MNQALAPGVICLAGPTASGKTAAALAIAGEFDCEIISVDSALVYRGMDIGTAKPPASELARVPHHLIDIRDPLQAYSAAEFVSDARDLIEAIRARGRTPLLVGGTMLYFKALRQGLDDLPRADAALREAIGRDAALRGWPALHAELARHDAPTAARLAPTDAQRIGRAIEILRLTGRPMSDLLRGAPETPPLPFDLLAISLEPSDRAVLHQRIAERFDAMLQAGLVDEVRALRARFPDLTGTLPSMRCVGYRQAWDTLTGALPARELRDRGIFATRQLAKRQITWLRAMEDLRRFDCLRSDLVDAVTATAQRFLEEETA